MRDINVKGNLLRNELIMPVRNDLDDLGKIRKIDKSNMVSFCVNAPKHYEKAAALAKTLPLMYPKPKMIVVAGMGGSGIGGELLKDWSRNRLDVPVDVCRDYSLPKCVDEGSLVFVLSYSGETEESLSVFLEAARRKCMIFCISSGGSLGEFAQKLNVPYLQIPQGMPPRAALPYLFLPTVLSLETMGLVSGVDLEISETSKVLRSVCGENLPQIPLKRNFSKTLALNLQGTIPVIYGFGMYRAVAQRFKTQMNENSKVPAKSEVFPELNHNEIVGWEKSDELAKWFSVIFIRDKTESVEIKQRIETTKELLREKSFKLLEVWSEGMSPLAKMCSVVCIGDFVSAYLAISRGVDPTPVRTIALLKQKLEKNGTKQKILRELRRLA
jgi:glucose/mannose-6-phosphate isomerase